MFFVSRFGCAKAEHCQYCHLQPHTEVRPTRAFLSNVLTNYGRRHSCPSEGNKVGALVSLQDNHKGGIRDNSSLQCQKFGTISEVFDDSSCGKNYGLGPKIFGLELARQRPRSSDCGGRSATESPHG